jgi:hypothetical protein
MYVERIDPRCVFQIGIVQAELPGLCFRTEIGLGTHGKLGWTEKARSEFDTCVIQRLKSLVRMYMYGFFDPALGLDNEAGQVLYRAWRKVVSNTVEKTLLHQPAVFPLESFKKKLVSSLGGRPDLFSGFRLNLGCSFPKLFYGMVVAFYVKEVENRALVMLAPVIREGTSVEIQCRFDRGSKDSTDGELEQALLDQLGSAQKKKREREPTMENGDVQPPTPMKLAKKAVGDVKTRKVFVDLTRDK